MTTQWQVTIPPIIDRPLFDRVQSKLSANNARNTPPRVVNGPCLLTGLARCARCGSSMTRTGTVRGRRRYSYYTCVGGHSTGLNQCKGRHKRMELVDAAVIDAVRGRLLEPTKIAEVISALTAQLSSKEENGRQRLLHLEATVAETGTKLRRLYATIEDGTAELDDVLKGRISELRQELSRNQAELEKAKAVLPKSIAVDVAKIERFSRLVTEKLEHGDVNARKAYLRSFIDAVEIDDKRIRIIGRKTTLLDAVNGRSSSPRIVRGFDREWRARKDSNL
ncbi:recombinase zinc beta ribbon domain-containing protein [Rhabdaerophilum calidifontis]|uniref:recombinase zinc beta ribbon domain-containing protein n=1 Tax=Rhabdaerophilum calidifontis TaxID=2604328 RepID=UPI001239B89C|nr:recombinase zinc beta ribbon domain-containing protein [Rhabdaerophilum calidifontis]